MALATRATKGVPPRLNASRAPGLWQHLDIVFRAPKFDGKRKIANARFVRVVLNGAVVQENVEVTGPTRAAPFEDERATGPLMIQGDHGPVAVRNIQYKAYTGIAKLNDLRFRAYTGDEMDSAWIGTHKPVREGAAAGLSSAPAEATNKFAVAFDGALTVPTTGRYRFIINLDWVGAEPAMQGPAVAGATLSVDGKPVLAHRGAARRAMADVDLTAGKHAFALSFFKNRQYGAERDLKLWIEGPGVERQPLHDESLLSTAGTPISPIVLEATDGARAAAQLRVASSPQAHARCSRWPTRSACTTATTSRRARRSSSGAAPSSRRRRCGTAAERIRSRDRSAA